LVGGIVGAGVALLLAPESGWKMRKRIVHFSEDAKEKAEGSLEGVKDKVTTAFEKGKVLLKRA
jgi:gas vesicle protein